MAMALAARGANVVIHFRSSADEAEETAEEARNLGVGAWTVRADLGRRAEVETLFGEAVDQAGFVDILINSASIFPESRLDAFTPDDLYANIDVNALAPLLLARAFVARAGRGAIINMLDTRYNDHDASHAAYHLSKRMLFTLTRMMAVEYAPDVRVNAIAPGLVLPPPGKDRQYLLDLAHTNPLGAIGGPDDIARAAVFLLESPFITGQVIFVDGGRHMKGSMYG
jgi:hypothetical protein